MDNTKTTAVESTAKISYQFTAVPTKLMMLLDNNCRSMLFTLIQLSSCYANEDGYFFRSNSDLQAESNLSKNLVIVTIDTLYTNGIVDVKCSGNKCKKIANYYKLNFDKILEYENISLEDTKNPDNKITTLKYKNSDYVPSYKTAKETATKTAKETAKETATDTAKETATETATDTAKETATDTAKSEHQKPQKVNTNIDSINLDNEENLNNKENLNNLYITYNSKNDLSEKLTYLESIDEGELFPFIKYLLLQKLIDKDFYYKAINRTIINNKLKSYQVLELNGKANYL